MALKKCKECGKEISSDADKCPNCGKPQKKRNALGYFVAIIIIIGFIGWITSTLENTNSTTTQTAIEDLPKLAFYKSQEYMRGYLKGPAGADFPYYDSASVKRVAGDGKGTMFEVTSYVDSQNSFGAKIRTTYKCSIVRVHADSSWVMAELKAW